MQAVCLELFVLKFWTIPYIFLFRLSPAWNLEFYGNLINDRDIGNVVISLAMFLLSPGLPELLFLLFVLYVRTHHLGSMCHKIKVPDTHLPVHTKTNRFGGNLFTPLKPTTGPNPHFFNFHSALKSRQRFTGTRDSEAQTRWTLFIAMTVTRLPQKVQIARCKRAVPTNGTKA